MGKKNLMCMDRAWVKKILMDMNMKIPPPVENESGITKHENGTRRRRYRRK
jgi:hypothetical protein